MSVDLDFLDEVAVFLDTVPPVITPRNSARENEYQQLVVGAALSNSESLEVLDSSSDDLVSADQFSENEATSVRKTKNTGKQKGDNRRKRYRERVKNVRIELTCMKEELTLRLQEVIEARERKKSNARTDLTLSKTFWYDLATQQQQKRQRSEMEHRRLVAAVQSQNSYIDNLCNVLRVRNADSDIQAFKWLRLKSSDASLYQVYLKEVNDSYASTDQMFQECGMASLPIGTVSKFHRLGQGEIQSTQYVHKLLLPFSFEDTCNNMWKTAKLPHRQIDREVYEDVGDADNTVGFKIRLKKTLTSGSSVSILKRVLSRRFQDGDRAVHVHRIFSEGEGIFSGLDSDETAWSSVRPYSDETRTGTLIEVCSRQMYVPFITANPEASTVKAFKDTMQNAIKEDEREIIKTLEKLLLDDTLAQIGI
ncbi:hypothetical protein F441_13353 [Phytophthora nicotianae CJ01A1]|uniref:Uncharacterized protein n=1 Tax=Phytophthora nicotianae CJ01A1 TaxID=1317063 RepID=W2WLW3_PHYNI|nr:hypothetical protein F441_13353 [Phytophthora nicotianae CJ01A1]